MKLHLTLKQTTKTLILSKLINSHLITLARLLSKFKIDYRVDIFIKKQKNHFFLPRLHHKYSNFTDRRLSLAFFEGFINLPLPHKTLHVLFKATSPEFGLKQGFKQLEREILRYKETHFKGHSKYPNHLSVRNHV